MRTRAWADWGSFSATEASRSRGCLLSPVLVSGHRWGGGLPSSPPPSPPVWEPRPLKSRRECAKSCRSSLPSVPQACASELKRLRAPPGESF